MSPTSPTWILATAVCLAGCIRQSVPESTTTRVGPAGGTAISADGKFSLEIPTGALASDVDIVIETDRTQVERQVGATYRVAPATLQLAVPAIARLQAPESWVGELWMGSPERGQLVGASFMHAGGPARLGSGPVVGARFEAVVRTLDCAERGCSTASECADGAACVQNRCRYQCVTDFECANPVTCPAGARDCTRAGGGRCASHACVALPIEQLLDARELPRTDPGALTCTSPAFTLFADAAEDACAGRACGEPCGACDAAAPSCVTPAGSCDGAGICSGSAVSCPAELPGPDGWDDAPGSGKVFIVSAASIVEGTRGFDLDGQCTGTTCVDNRLAPFGRIANDQLRQGLLGGEMMVLVEIAGLEEPFDGTDGSVTVKLYGGRDFDDPFFPANNFSVPAGERECCKFLVNRGSLIGSQARTRIPARVQRGILSSAVPSSVQFSLTIGVPPHPELHLERVRLSARLPANLESIEDLLLGGAVPINSLAQTENPYCKTINVLCDRQLPDSTLLDLLSPHLQPDIDLDVPADGLETLVSGAHGRVDECRDGCGDACLAVPPVDAAAPWTCALDPRMADGFSIALDLRGVAATIVGVAQ